MHECSCIDENEVWSDLKGLIEPFENKSKFISKEKDLSIFKEARVQKGK